MTLASPCRERALPGTVAAEFTAKSRGSEDLSRTKRPRGGPTSQKKRGRPANTGPAPSAGTEKSLEISAPALGVDGRERLLALQCASELTAPELQSTSN